ncbi:hypothetical protein ACETK8_14435 [Brevundimonas staleyi]|uniref:Uncharacterized protein n=1 Tax=Brevundimonas staleyi TaxID=74326 RepID=A0ABW0FUU7_9CAUL
MGDSQRGQGAMLSAASWPNGSGRVGSILDATATVARWLGSILLIPLVVLAFAVLVVDQRYLRGRSWGSILGTADR